MPGGSLSAPLGFEGAQIFIPIIHTVGKINWLVTYKKKKNSTILYFYTIIVLHTPCNPYWGTCQVGQYKKSYETCTSLKQGKMVPIFKPRNM